MAHAALRPGHDSERAARRDSIPLAAVFGDDGVAAREREHDLAADAGRGLAAAVGKNDHAEALSRDHADISRRVAEPAVLADEDDVAVAHELPGERLGEARVHREHARLASAIASSSGRWS